MMNTKKHIFLISTFLLILFASCVPTVNTDMELYPIVSTRIVTNITDSSAICGGTIVNSGNYEITERGVLYSVSNIPSKNDIKISNGKNEGTYLDTIISYPSQGNIIITSGTTYYARAYAITPKGPFYGNTVQFTTSLPNTIPNPILNSLLTYGTTTDIDGNIYETITIGSQTWMAENLIVTKYSNGDPIANVTDNAKWNELTTGAQCTYNNSLEANSVRKFGRLYNFYAVSDSRNLAPTGWHIASDAEWNILVNFVRNNLGASTSAAQALATTTDWTISSIPNALSYIDPNVGVSNNNSSGFCALPSGIRANYGDFNYVGNYSAWWTSNQNDKTTAWFRNINFYDINTGKNTYGKQYGLSVRCIKN